MKKFTILVFVIFSLISNVVFAESHNLRFILSVEEDYGIVIPEDALKLDRFVFEYSDVESDAEYLIKESSFEVGSLSMGENSTTLTLKYYGNLSEDYEVVISCDPGTGWNIDGSYLPITVEYVEAVDKPEDVIVSDIRYGEVYVNVPATGSRSAVPIVDLILSWAGEPNLSPGTYEVDLTLGLSVV